MFRMLGVSPEDVLKRSTDQSIHDFLKDRVTDPNAYISSYEPLRQNPYAVLEDVFAVVGREQRAVHRHSAPLFDADGDFVGRVEVYSDITKRRALEKAAVKAYEQLRTTQEQLVQSEKLRAVGEIASGVAHDFNNTLGIVLGNIQMLLRSTVDEAARARLKAAERAALDAVDTIRRIQDFTRMAPRDEPKPFDLNSIVSEAVDMMKPAWQDAPHARGAEIKLDLDLTEPMLALGNTSEMREVLINIILNAVQAIPNSGSIAVSTGCSTAHAWARIADTGIGMTEDVRKRVFDPFFTTRGMEGSGLGMSVVYGIVRRHNGSISVESEPGKGTIVTVFLPVAEGKVVEQEIDRPSESDVLARASILVVDDEAMFAEVLVEMLAECGHAAAVAHSGIEAIEMFKKGNFDLVLTDLGMPQMSGLQVAEAVKKVKPETPVALLTGWGAGLDRGDMDESVVDLVLPKPVSLENLSAAVAAALAKSAPREM